MSQIHKQLEQFPGGLHPVHAKKIQEGALPPALHWDLSCMGMPKFSVRHKQESSSAWDSVSMKNYGSHAWKHAWKFFHQLRKTPWSTQENPLLGWRWLWKELLLSLRWTKATLPIMCEQAGCRLAQVEEYSCTVQRHCVDRKPSTVGTQEDKAWRNRLYLSTWENHLEWRVSIHGAWSLESFCIFTID